MRLFYLFQFHPQICAQLYFKIFTTFTINAFLDMCEEQRNSSDAKATYKWLVKLVQGVISANLMVYNANVLEGILWRNSVSPTKLHPSLSVHSSRIYAQLLCHKL
jgi:hypothetical protein